MFQNWALRISFDVPPACDVVTVANETIATMQTREACRFLDAGPALTISTDFGATLVAGEAVRLGNGVTVNDNAELTVGGCAHDLCTAGTALVSGCAPCVTSICAVDPYCCNVMWDGICINRVGSTCCKICP